MSQLVFDFSYNWNNKLNNKYFTTLRLNDKFKVGETYPTHFKGKPRGIVTVVDKRHLFLADINDWIAYLDTGYSRAECQKILQTMYKSKGVNWSQKQLVLYLLKAEQQQELL